LVTYLFFLVSALALFSILRKFTNNTAIPFTGMAAYLGAFVYTNQPGSISEWGLFQKHHEFTASLLASVAWAAVMFKEGDVPRRKAWTFFTSLLVMHTILFAPTTFPLVLLTFALLVLAAAVKKSWPLVRSFSVVGGVAAAVLLSLMANNYLVTGMAEITPFRTYWKYADQEKFSKSWSPYLMVLLEEGSAPGMGDIQVVEHTNITRFEYIKQIVRAHTIRYFLPGWDLVSGKYVASVLVCACVVLYLVGRRAPFPLWRVAIPIGGMLLVAVGLSQIVNQPISAYRYFSFTVFFTVTGVVVLWIVLFRLLPSRKLTGFTSYLLPTGLTCWITVHTFIALPDDEFRFCRDFTLGRTSLADGYGYRQHAVYPPAVAMRRLIGPEARVYTFNQNNYSMAPGCELESFVSFALGTDWHEIMFEPPERARELLQKQGLNYFLIDFDSLVLDLSQHSALFQPANVEKYFGVRWRQGNVYLLTWRGNDTEPLANDFMCRYNDDYFNKWFCTRPLYERVKLIYEMNKGNPYPIRRDPTLPPVKGWQ
jgi:hypothetical protein